LRREVKGGRGNSEVFEVGLVNPSMLAAESKRPTPKTEIPKSSGKNLNMRETVYMDIERRAGVYLSVGPKP